VPHYQAVAETKTSTPPSGALWLHEIKHDGFRVIARKDGTKVRLYSRPGNDLIPADRRDRGGPAFTILRDRGRGGRLRR
jgi:hypothetical protein